MGTSRKPDERDLERAKELSHLRRSRKWNQARLAHELGISPQQLGKYERGENRIPVGRYERAMAILGEPAAGRPGFGEGSASPYSGEAEHRTEIDRVLARMSGDFARLASDFDRLRELMERH